MDFRSLTVKDCFANPQCKAIIEQYAPQIMKYPIKLFNKKSCGEIVPVDVAKTIENKINEIL